MQTPNAAGTGYVQTDYGYDNLNRKIETIQPNPTTGTTSASDPNCPKAIVAYDPNGNVASTTDANGNTTSYAYNLDGERTKTTDALGDTTTTVYDAVGNVLSATDALGRTTTFQYDTMDRKVAESDPLPSPTAPRSARGQRRPAGRRRADDHLDLRCRWQHAQRNRSAGQLDFDFL